jgi:hypothetical protein
VGLSEDGHSVILAPRARGKGIYKVAIDDSLVAQLIAARDLLEAPPPPTPSAPARHAIVPAAESKLTIKEIQALLREGRTVESVARKAGVDPTWIERFEGPIVWERDGMADPAFHPGPQPPGPVGVAAGRSRRREPPAPAGGDDRGADRSRLGFGEGVTYRDMAGALHVHQSRSLTRRRMALRPGNV